MKLGKATNLEVSSPVQLRNLQTEQDEKITISFLKSRQGETFPTQIFKGSSQEEDEYIVIDSDPEDELVKSKTSSPPIMASVNLSDTKEPVSTGDSDSFCEDFLDSPCESNQAQTTSIIPVADIFSGESQLHLNALEVEDESPKKEGVLFNTSSSVLISNDTKISGETLSSTISSNQYFDPPTSDFEDLGFSGDESGYYGFSSSLLSEYKKLSEASHKPSKKRLLRAGFPLGFRLGHHQGRRAVVARRNSSTAPIKKKRLEISPAPKYLKETKEISVKDLEIATINSPLVQEQLLETSAEADSGEDDENEYDVEMIIAKRTKCGHREYLVKWRNYGHEANTWEPLSSLEGCKELVSAFNTSLRFNAKYTPPPDSFLLKFEFAKCKNAIKWLPENIQRFMEILSKDKGPIITVVNEIDEEGPPENFECVTELVYTKGVPLPSRSRVKNPCKCKVSCSANKSCNCIMRNDGIAPYSDTGLIQVSDGMPVYECTPFCGCPPTCKLKVVQQGRRVKIQVFKTKMKGWGVRAMQSIPKGTFVTEYLGEVITESEAERRGAECDREGQNYLFDLDGGQKENDYTIDGQYKGNVSHFFNHSCDANLVVHPVFVDNHCTSLHRLAFFANRNINYLDELCINYFGTTDEESVEDPNNHPEKNYDACQCGAYNCTGKFFK